MIPKRRRIASAFG